MPETRLASPWIDEDRPAPRVVRERIDNPRAQCIEHRLSGMQPDARLPRSWPSDAKPIPNRGRIAFQRRKESIQRARSARFQRKRPVQITLDADSKLVRGGFDEQAHVRREQMQVPFPVQLLAHTGKPGRDLAGRSVHLHLSFHDATYRGLGDRALNSLQNPLFTFVGERVDHELA